MKTTVLACSIRKFVTLLLAGIIVLNAAAQTGTTAPELVFMNPTLKSGNANKQGATYRFANVMTGVDAELKLKKFSRNDIVMQDVDLASLGWNKALQPKFGVPGTVAAHQDWYVEFELSFYKAGTNQKQAIQKFNLTALDVDGDGQGLAEYVRMDNPTSVSYSTVTALTGATTVSNSAVCPEDGISSPIVNCPTCHGSGRVTVGPIGPGGIIPLPVPAPLLPGPLGPNVFLCDDCSGTGKVYQQCGDPYSGIQQATGPVQNFLNIDTAATQVMATYQYVNRDKITFRIGAQTGDLGTSGDAGVRLNSLWYRQFSLAPMVALPVQLTNFAANLDNNSRVNLGWTTTSEKNFDHFNIQRSTDGKEYKDIALVFPGEELNAVRNYQYRDALTGNTAKVIYYRLQIVDRSGEITYSPVRMIRMGQSGTELQMIASPNPVNDELRLTLPAAWQGKDVTIEVYNLNGIRMQQTLKTAASQTESIRMGSLPRGAYLVTATSNGQSIQQRVIRQ